MWRVPKSKKNLVSNSNEGYTLVEMIVIMAILSVIMLLSFGAYGSSRKGQYVQNITTLTQLGSREVFSDVISTKKIDGNGGNCANRAPQLKALRVKLGESFNPIDKVSLCIGSAGILTTSTPEVLNGSMAYNEKVVAKFSGTVNGTTISDAQQGSVYLIFTSPFGQYHAFYDDAGTDPDFLLYLGTPDTGMGLTPQWQNVDNRNFVYLPVNTDKEVQTDMTIKISLASNSGIANDIVVSSVGNAKVK